MDCSGDNFTFYSNESFWLRTVSLSRQILETAYTSDFHEVSKNLLTSVQFVLCLLLDFTVRNVVLGKSGSSGPIRSPEVSTTPSGFSKHISAVCLLCKRIWHIVELVAVVK